MKNDRSLRGEIFEFYGFEHSDVLDPLQQVLQRL